MKQLIQILITTLSLSAFSHSQVSELKILPSGGTEYERFGHSVSMSGDYLIVGALYGNSYQGSAYIFKREGNNWIEEKKLTASDGTAIDEFGCSVSMSGDYVIVGAAFDDDIKGSAYIFRREGTNWIEEQKLTASDGAADDRFGCSVSMSGNYAIIGAWSADNWKGSAYIFRKDGANWIEEKKLTASDGTGGETFGCSVSISGDYAIVGAKEDWYGSAYIFRRDGTDWIEEDKLTASDGAGGDEFGCSVSISGLYVIVGSWHNDDALGAAYILRREGTNWIEEQKLTPSDGVSFGFGWSSSISGDYVIVGAIYYDYSKGSAYIFRKEGTNWIEEQRLTAFDGEQGDEYGCSVSISGDNAIVGAWNDEDNGQLSGSAYIYSGFVSGVDEQSQNPAAYNLYQNYPNPFNPTTTIKYSVPKLSFVTIKVYDVLGSEIATLVNEEKSVGNYEVEFDATGLPSDVYFYRLQTGSFVETKKMLLMK